jgi:DNA polymerase-4
VGERLRKHGLSGRTVTIKVRLHDFTTLSRSTTLASPTDNAATIGRLARSLLADLDTSGGVRLLGVGVSGLADWVQEDLFGEEEPDRPERSGHQEGTDDGLAAGSPYDVAGVADLDSPRTRPVWAPGMDVVHAELGAGWVWGSGRGVVTVRFETAETPPGPVRSFAIGDPALSRAPLPEG